MRQILWLLIGVLLVGTSVGQAAELEIITPPLLVRSTSCMVTNVSTSPVDIRIEVMNQRGEVQMDASNPEGLPPLWTSAVSGTIGVGTLRICRVTSDEGKKGDLRVTLCALAEDGTCVAAVTAE